LARFVSVSKHTHTYIQQATDTPRIIGKQLHYLGGK
jgi:hypothetical protein